MCLADSIEVKETQKTDPSNIGCMRIQPSLTPFQSSGFDGVYRWTSAMASDRHFRGGPRSGQQQCTQEPLRYRSNLK